MRSPPGLRPLQAGADDLARVHNDEIVTTKMGATLPLPVDPTLENLLGHRPATLRDLLAATMASSTTMPVIWASGEL